MTIHTTLWKVFMFFFLCLSCVTCHQMSENRKNLPGEISHSEASSFLHVSKRSVVDFCVDVTQEVTCELNKEICQNNNEGVRETLCANHRCPVGLTCYLTVPCPVHYQTACIADPCKSFPCQNGGSCSKTSDSKANCTCLPGYYEPEYCNLDCFPGPADIIFVVDFSESASVNKSMNYVRHFIQNIPIGPEDIRVGLVTFSWTAKAEFGLEDHQGNQTLLEALDNITTEAGGPTILTDALKLADTMMSQASIVRLSWIQRYIIVVSDGLFSDLYPAMAQAFKMQVRGIWIMAVGVGSTVSHKNLLNVCNRQLSDPTGVHSTDNDDLLNMVRKGTTHPACLNCAYRTDSDLVFLLDNSNIVKSIGYITEIMRYIVSNLQLGNNDIQVGMFTHNTNITMIKFPFDYSYSKDLLSATLSKVSIEGDNSSLSSALQYIRLNGFSTSHGARQNSRKIVIANINSVIGNIDAIESELKLMVSNGIHVFLIMTENVPSDDVRSLIKSLPQPFYFLYIPTSKDFVPLRVIDKQTIYYSCT